MHASSGPAPGAGVLTRESRQQVSQITLAECPNSGTRCPQKALAGGVADAHVGTSEYRLWGEALSARYCCDELVADLESVQLAVLRELKSRRNGVRISLDLDERVRASIEALWVIQRGGAGPLKVPGDPTYERWRGEIERYLHRWRTGKDIASELRDKRPIGEPAG